MAQDYTSLLENLHNNALMNTTSAPPADLIVGENRQFTTRSDFDTIIAYEGDVNNKIITIQMPRYSARHELALCTHKELKWSNLANGAEGVSKLNRETTDSDEGSNIVLYEWEVPAEICSHAGNIEISISFYDLNIDDTVAFSWNTAAYSGLTVGKTMSSVGAAYPALNEILVINEETHDIIAPQGYNNIICNYGDKGTAEVYFVINRYLGKNHLLDVYKSGVSIYVKLNGLYGLDNENIEKMLYSSEISDRKNEGMVLLKWKVPVGITAGKGGPNTMQIAFQIDDGTRRWFSGTYDKLTIGHSLFEYSGDEDTEEWDPFTDFVVDIIEDYFSNGLVVFDSNTEI